MKSIISIFLIMISEALGNAGSVQSPLEAREKLRSALMAAISPKISVQVENLQLSTPPGPQASYRVLSPHPPLGLVQFEVSWQAGERLRRIYGSAVVKGRAKVAVAKVPLRHGDLISHSNVVFEERELSPFLQTGYFLEWEDILSHRANGYVRPGTVLGTSHVSQIQLIEQNQMVDLFYEKGAVRIVAKVKALDSGSLSDLIRVQNPKTRKTLQARVVGAGQVEIR